MDAGAVVYLRVWWGGVKRHDSRRREEAWDVSTWSGRERETGGDEFRHTQGVEAKVYMMQLK